jgi:hypothetical protein
MNFASSLLLAALVQNAPVVTHERLGENRYRLHIVVPSAAQLDAAHGLMDRTMRALCRDLHPILGDWEAVRQIASPNAQSPPPAVDIYQDLTCSEELPTPPAGPSPMVVSPSWAPSDADEDAVRAVSEAFLEARDSGRSDDAYRLLAPTFQATETLAAFTQRTRAHNSKAGRRIDRRLVALTWYHNNLPGAPPGLYAAVDFRGDYERLHFTCGYMIWQLQADRAWRLVTMNQAMVSRADAPDASAADLAMLRREMRCRD